MFRFHSLLQKISDCILQSSELKQERKVRLNGPVSAGELIISLQWYWGLTAPFAVLNTRAGFEDRSDNTGKQRGIFSPFVI